MIFNEANSWSHNGQYKLELINIMLYDRIKSPKKLAYPQSREAIDKRKEQIIQYGRQLFSKQSCRSSKRSISTAQPQSNSQSRIFLQSSLQNRLRSAFETNTSKIDPVLNRSSTQSIKKCHDRSSSPLSIIRSKSKCQSEHEKKSSPQRQHPIRSDFLRKGSSVDRTIIKNVLKSKLNMNVCSNTYSYVDAPQNGEITKIIEKQIPRGIQDIVGVEEMMRMSHIITGVQFKTVNLQERVKKAVKEHAKISRLQHHTEDEDHLTLKSIKRW